MPNSGMGVGLNDVARGSLGHWIEIENKKFVMDKIRESFHLFVSQAFEKICMEYLLVHPPFEMQKIGRWWDNREEIDIAAISQEEMLVGECKWWDEQVGINVLRDLERKTAFIDNEAKKIYFAVFAKKGFTKELEQKAISEKNILLYDIGKIF
jgi:AAA+ ATPase superfamily predicted ATPase